jgi:hypothetical protein
MRVLLSTYGSRGDVEPMAAEICDARVASCAMAAGVWR